MISPAIHTLLVQITGFARDDNPGWVTCEFHDAEGKRHSFEEKGPVVSSYYLDESSEYPQEGSIGCSVLSRWHDADGRDLVRISTEVPWGIESSEGISEFVVLSTQLRADGELI